MKIIIDTFGADSKPEVIIRGAVKSVLEQTEYDLILVTEPLIADIVVREEAEKAEVLAEELFKRISVLPATSFVTNKDDPRCVIKEKTDSSMVLAYKALKEDDDICAMVTAGSTGCALVASCFHLGLKKGLLQPALCSMLLCENGKWVALCDCGSNLNPKVKDFADYATLGAEFASAFYSDGEKEELPKVGLINVGKEPGKGTDLSREVYEKLSENSGTTYQFIGNIEGGDILSGAVDAAVCDGFTGNVILKGLEKAGLICAQIAENAGSEIISDKIKDTFDYNNRAGAVFLGTKKIVIKAHGAANENTIKSCIAQAIRLNQGGYLKN
ncbi:MAG: hypothetical protein MJ086_02065 [Lachnospiraceae bacterium]|nr:hypothetical protein [Lachnospiraceae bacterium]